MRAMMSSNDNRPLGGYVWTEDGVLKVSETACAEARAILAETEPESHDIERWDNGVLSRGSLKYHLFLAEAMGQADLWDAADCFAESLAAFIAEPGL